MTMELPVLYDDRLVAMITADATRTELAYSQAWRDADDRFAISLAMPIREQPYSAELVLPWLMNLLPEGEPLRAMMRVLGTASEDVLGLIIETGNDLAGALTIAPQAFPGAPGYREIPDASTLERILTDLPARPFLVDEEGVSMSLAGAQDKLPVALREGELSIPVNGAASTHILKPDNPRLIDSVQNEALCMVLAHRVGLDVAPAITGRAGARSYLLVTRYDRHEEGNVVRRLHQEDFCQALGRPPGAKYEFNRTGPHGPSLAEMFGVVRQHMTGRDITRLLDAVIFNIAIGNVDSHAKNYSALLEPAGARLAPLYDLMSGLAWDGITPNHAQEVGGQRRGRYIYERHWRRMAEAAGLGGRGTVQRVEQVTARILRELPAAAEDVAAMPAGAGVMLDIFVKEMTGRASEVRAHARENGDDMPAENAASDDEEAAATAYHG
jgi:serine/threonine-protein kinase HipA